MSTGSTPLSVPATGVFPPLVTPLTAAGEFDAESMQRQTEAAIDAGVKAVWVNGTTAEFYALSDDERTEAVRAAASVAGPRGVATIAQVGAPSTRLAVRLAERAAEAGADALCAVAPYYMPYSQAEIKRYLQDIHRATGLPLYLYQVPAMTKVIVAPETILELVEDGVAAGIKDSYGDATWIRYLLEEAKARGVTVPVFVGDALLLDTTVLAGGAGAITAVATVLPRHVQAACAAALSGDWERCSKLQSELVSFLLSLRLPTRPSVPRIFCLKVLLAELGVIATDVCAAPFTPFSEEERDFLRGTAMTLMQRLEAADLEPLEL